jgi:lipoprotein-anchoring transpeptidase ErfK/SrfK
VRHRASTWAMVATAALVVGTGCSSGQSGNHSGGSTGPGADPTSAAKPLHVVSVTPRLKLSPTAAITVTFTAPLPANSALPTLAPAVPGTWARTGTSAVFTPSQAYPPDQPISVRLIKRPGGRPKLLASPMTPTGSLLRAQQILARLHYLPLTTSAATATTTAEEANDVYAPPPGAFSWRYANTPKTLKRQWTPGGSGEVLRGAVIAFQHHTSLPVDASIGPMTWAALIKADLFDKVDPHHYSFVSADLHLPQRLSVWEDGSTVLTSPVNGGVAGAPTPLGTYPVYERFPSTTMSGTNPDGSSYKDPGVPWVNYFSGGSAVHGFPRASYGSPQSVGCLELPIPTAAKVYKLISYGTLVDVVGPHEAAGTQGAPAPPKPSH